MAELQDTLAQIEGVLNRNKRTEIFLLVGIGSLFTLGIVSLALALWKGEYAWSIPSAAAALFLKWPIERVDKMRRGNIALAVAPIFVAQLPAAKAAQEIQRILQELFKDHK